MKAYGFLRKPIYLNIALTGNQVACLLKGRAFGVIVGVIKREISWFCPLCNKITPKLGFQKVTDPNVNQQFWVKKKDRSVCAMTAGGV